MVIASFWVSSLSCCMPIKSIGCAQVEPRRDIWPMIPQSISTDEAAAEGSHISSMDPKLYAAATKGKIRELEGRDDVHVQLTPKKNTVLHVAAQFGQAECVKWILLRSPSLLKQANEKGDTPLHHAAREGHLKVVQHLIDAAKNPVAGNLEGGAAADCKEMLRMTNREVATAMHEAVRYHRPKVVSLLIQEDKDFTYGANAEGKTPLYIAAEWGFRDLVEMIIDKCSSPPNYSGIRGRTALHAAVILNDEAMTKMILSKRPDLTKALDDQGWSPLHFAAYVGCDRTLVSQLLEKSDSSVVYLALKEHGKLNRTALHVAASRGHVGVVEELLSRFPDCCENVDDEGNNVLHLIMPKYKFINSGLPYVSCLRLKELMNEKNLKGKTPVDLLHDSPTFKGDEFISFEGKAIWIIVENLARLLKKWSPSFRPNATPLGSLEIKEDSNIISSENKELEKMGEMKKTMKNHMIVATLIATVTFAAGFTLPGGYIQDSNTNQGMAVLSFPGAEKPNAYSRWEDSRIREAQGNFKLFVIADGIAMVFSMCAVGTYFLAALPIKEMVIIQICFFYSLILTLSAMSAMVVAFHASLQAVLVNSFELEDFTSIMFPLFYLMFLVPFIFMFLPPRPVLRVAYGFRMKFPVTISYRGKLYNMH